MFVPLVTSLNLPKAPSATDMSTKSTRRAMQNFELRTLMIAQSMVAIAMAMKTMEMVRMSFLRADGMPKPLLNMVAALQYDMLAF
jgi:hypothetical protein